MYNWTAHAERPLIRIRVLLRNNDPNSNVPLYNHDDIAVELLSAITSAVQGVAEIATDNRKSAWSWFGLVPWQLRGSRDVNNKRHTIEWPEERCLVEIDQGGQTHRSRVSMRREKCFSMTYLTRPTPLVDVKLHAISTFFHSIIDTSRCLEWSPTPATFMLTTHTNHRHATHKISLDWTTPSRTITFPIAWDSNKSTS